MRKTISIAVVSLMLGVICANAQTNDPEKLRMMFFQFNMASKCVKANLGFTSDDIENATRILKREVEGVSLGKAERVVLWQGSLKRVSRRSTGFCENQAQDWR